MEKSTAIGILAKLAEGVDPDTGEDLSRQGVFNQPDVIRALHTGLQELLASLERQRKKSSLPSQTGKAWTKEEETVLLQHFEVEMSFSDIAKQLQRTRGSIIARLEKLGKIPQGSGWQSFSGEKDANPSRTPRN